MNATLDEGTASVSWAALRVWAKAASEREDLLPIKRTIAANLVRMLDLQYDIAKRNPGLGKSLMERCLELANDMVALGGFPRCSATRIPAPARSSSPTKRR